MKRILIFFTSIQFILVKKTLRLLFHLFLLLEFFLNSILLKSRQAQLRNFCLSSVLTLVLLKKLRVLVRIWHAETSKAQKWQDKVIHENNLNHSPVRIYVLKHSWKVINFFENFKYCSKISDCDLRKIFMIYIFFH